MFAIKKMASPVFRTFVFSVLSIASSHAAQIYVDSDTFLKTTTGQSSSLPAASKCAFSKGQSFEIKSIVDGGASHWQVVLPRAYAGCALTSGFIYQPHVATESTTLSVKVPTVFKKTTASASTLPASSKCDMPTNIYPLSGTATTNASHFSVNLKSLFQGCAFSAGFVYDGHSSVGIAQLSLSSVATFKKTTADAATLPATDKCDIATANYVLTTAPVRSGVHYSVDMVTAPAGCGFKTGFVAFETTYLGGPVFNPANYTTPLANGIAGPGDQSWCVCRNVGTSPHIGQDWNADGAENSVAIADGAIVDKTFSSTCGHTLTVRDSSGADWIYRHLNSNTFQIGQAVTKGLFLGSHSSYPTSSCGTGPHLHIERRSAGAFADSAVFKSCEAGPEACYFNPNSPFLPQTALLKSAPLAAAPLAATTSPALSSGAATKLAMVEDMTATGELDVHSACRFNPEQYSEVAPSALAEYSAAPKSLTLASERIKHAGHAGRGPHDMVSVATALENNAENRCAKGQNCLTSFSLIVQTTDGKLVRLFHDGTIRNRAAAVIAEEGYCLPSNATGKGFILVTDKNGARYRQEVKF